MNGDGWKVGTNSVVVGLSLSDQHEAMTVPENCVVQEIYLTDTTTSPQDISFNYNENGDNVPSSDCTQASVVVLVYGMNDKLTYKFCRKDIEVFKYLPYGYFRETLPYLGRRLYENYGVLKYIYLSVLINNMTSF